MDATKHNDVKRNREVQVDTNEDWKKKARSFAKKVYAKYGEKELSLENIFKKAYKMSKEEDISTEQFNYFMDFYPTIANRDTHPDDYAEPSKIGKAIGTVHPSFAGIKGKFNIDEKMG